MRSLTITTQYGCKLRSQCLPFREFHAFAGSTGACDGSSGIYIHTNVIKPLKARAARQEKQESGCGYIFNHI
jgi:hypothetical protein